MGCLHVVTCTLYVICETEILNSGLWIRAPELDHSPPLKIVMHLFGLLAIAVL